MNADRDSLADRDTLADRETLAVLFEGAPRFLDRLIAAGLFESPDALFAAARSTGGWRWSAARPTRGSGQHPGPCRR